MNKILLASMLGVIIGLWLIFGFVMMDWDVTRWNEFGRVVYVVFCVWGVMSVCIFKAS